MVFGAKPFLTQEEADRIVAAVREAEARTSAEIVPLVAERSYDYLAARVLGSLALALLLAVPLAWRLGGSMWTLLGLQGLFFFVGLGLMRLWPGLQRLFIPSEEMDEEVDEAAALAFLRHEFHKAGGAREALLYVSVFERRARALVSPAVAQAVPGAVWTEVVDEAIRAGAEGRLGDGIVMAVRRMGDVLSVPFPPGEGDRDERENLLRG